jgi:hypothetical protein
MDKILRNHYKTNNLFNNLIIINNLIDNYHKMIIIHNKIKYSKVK